MTRAPIMMEAFSESRDARAQPALPPPATLWVGWSVVSDIVVPLALLPLMVAWIGWGGKSGGDTRRGDTRRGDPLGYELIRPRIPESRRGLGAVYTPLNIVRAMVAWAGPVSRHLPPGLLM